MCRLLCNPVIHCLLYLASALPVSENPSSAIVQRAQAPLGSGVTCNDLGFGRSGFFTEDCYPAIRQLPSTHLPGNFHAGGTRDDYQLPVIKSHGRCELEIDFSTSENAGVEYSWLALRAAATELALACATQPQGRTNGGTTITEPRGRFRVAFSKDKDNSDVETNSTLTS